MKTRTEKSSFRYHLVSLHCLVLIRDSLHYFLLSGETKRGERERVEERERERGERERKKDREREHVEKPRST